MMIFNMSIKETLIRIFEWFYHSSNSQDLVLSQAKDIENLKLQLQELKAQFIMHPKVIDYSFIPDNYQEAEGEVITNKTMQSGIALNLDIRDLFNSTIYSRRWADEVIDDTFPVEESDSKDEYFNRLCLAVANKTLVQIEYISNKAQFNVSDRWSNGDTAIETLKGDCDLSVRVFVRVMLDVLDKLGMYEYKKYIFQSVGYMAGTGHSWAKVYDPVSKYFRLIEATKDTPYTELPRISASYDMYFCLNFRKIFWTNDSWKAFL